MRAFAAARTGPEELRRRIRQTLFVPDPLPELKPEVHGRFEPEPGIVAERVSYATQYGMRVPAILYLPKQRTGRIPALIIVNGHGGDKYSWYAGYSGILYARAGAAVLTYDPIGEGERNAEKKSGTRAHDTLERDRILGRRLGGLMMTDVMQATSYLSSRPEVDPARIAAAGYSMGSFVLSLACATETRLNACVLAGGGNLDGFGEYWDSSKPLCQAYPYQSLEFLGDRPAIIYRLHAQRGPTLAINGLKDGIMQPQRRDPVEFFKQLQARIAMPSRVFDTEYIKDGGHRPYFVTRKAALWLERNIDFPNWDESRIRSMPETHILPWAKERGVAMDKLYATELSEGGTRALGEGIPGSRVSS
jgi:dienelactone hydrolase